MADFEAKITGIADLSKAKQDFDSFKKLMEQPIKITVDTSGFNAVWSNLQRQAQSIGSQAGRQYAQGFEKNIAAIDTTKVANNMLKGVVDRVSAKNGKGSLSLSIFGNSGLKELGASSAVFKTLEKELDSIKQKGLQIQSIKFNETGTSFVAKAINDMGTLVTLTSKWKEAVAKTDKQGNFLGVEGGEWKTNIQYLTDFTAGVKKAQAEADKLSQSFKKIQDSFSNGTFNSTFDANVKRMESNVSSMGSTVSPETIKKVNDAFAEYYGTMRKIQTTMDGTAKNPLTQEQVVSQYEKAQAALKRYGEAWKEVRIEQGNTITEGQANKNADAVKAWCNRNSKALKKYGEELDEIQKKMRTTFDANAQKELQQQAQQIYKKAESEGSTGLSFADQIKKAFLHIGEFTGIYALTSRLRQIPHEMVQEVIKIDTAMTELQKVSTASASDIGDYFDRATDSAYKYGQAINEVIDSTASWTRLGYNLDEAENLTNASIALARVGSGMDVNSSTSAIQSTIKGFGMAAEEAQHVADIVNYIADTEPIDARGIGEGLTRFSSAMSMAGNTLEESIGLLTASTAVTQDPSKSANDWRTISMRIRGAKTELEAMGEDTTGMVTSVSKIREEFKALSGVDIMKDEKTFKSTTQIVLELADAWEHMTDIQKASLGELAGGKRGAQSLFAAVQNADIIRKTIADSNGEAVGSVDRQMAVWESSIQASLDRFHVAFQELSTDIINSDWIKGIVDAGTAIIKIIDELVEHIGVLGTAITGLGIAKIISTAASGAKSVEVAVDGVEFLGDALEAAQGSGSGLAGTIKGLSGVLGGLSAKAGGAGTALSGMFGSLGTLLTNPVGIGVAIAGAVIGAGVLIRKHIKKQQEELIKQATEATSNWGDTQKDVEQYKQQYRDLNEQLSQSNLTESERIGIKQQLLNLQNEITAKYGDQVSGINLVNGGLETQLGILSNINTEVAKRNLRENDEAYKASINEMTKIRTYTLNSGSMSGGMGVGVASEQMQKQLDDLYTSANFKKHGDLFEFTGDATDFDEAVNTVLDGLEKLKDGASEYDKAILQSSIDNAQEAFTKNNEILTANQENYRAYLQQSLYAEGFGDELAEYARRAQVYNDALFSGDAEKINEAKQQLDDYKGTVKEITDAHAEYGNFFDEVANSVDKTSEKVYQFSDIIKDGVADSSNDLAEFQSEIFSAVNDLKALGLDGVDVQNILLNGGVGFEDLSALAKLYDPNFDFSDPNVIANFADFLAQLGVVAGGAGDGIDLVKDSFDGFMKSASESIETIDKVNSALVNAFASGGLSMGVDKETGALTGDVATIMSAYKDLESYNPERLFERTADGIIVNTKALREMRAEQERTMKSEFEKRIQEAQENLNKAIESGNASEIQAWKTRLQNVELLSTAYDGATSAYQKWLDAQKGGEMGDQYDTVVNTALKRGKELYDQGLVGTNEFRALAQLYSGQDLSTASIDEVVKAYEDGASVVKKYFTTGQEGAVAFADKLVDLELATKDAQGNYDFSEGIDTQELADELGISVDLVEAAFKKLNDYGFDIHFVSPETAEALNEINEKAIEAQDTLKNLANEEGKIGNLDVSSAINLDVKGLDTVQECDDALEELSKNVPDPKVNPAAYEAFRDLIDEIQEKRDLLTDDTSEVPINFDTLSAGFSKMDELQQRIKAIGEMNEEPGINLSIEGDDKVQQLSEEIANLPEDMKVSLGFEANDDASEIVDKLEKQTVTIPVQYQQPTNDLNTSATVRADFDSSSVAIPDQTVHVDAEPNPLEVQAVAKLDSTAVDEYTPKEIPEQTVTYKKESSKVDNYNPPNFDRSVDYDINVYGSSAVDNLPSSGSRYITYYISTVGTPPAYKGTVPNSAFIGMSHAGGTAHANGLSRFGLKQDENALINEVGAEIVVRPSEDSWMIFNGGKPTMGAPLKKGDIKIYCVHVQKCA